MDLTPRTVVAVRDDPQSAWRMVRLACTLEDLSQCLAGQGLSDAEKRLVYTGHVPADRFDHIPYWGLRGWSRVDDSDRWLPVDEPLPINLPTSVEADLGLSLISIMSGYIVMSLEANGERAETVFDDVIDDLALFVRFVQVLAAGGQPHAALTDRAGSIFVVQNLPQSDLCQFHAMIFCSELPRLINIAIERRKLVQRFRMLADAIADHPNLAHHFICHICLPDQDYGRVDHLAQAEWERGVSEGRWPDDYDAEDAFVASRLTADLPLAPECEALASTYRAMLRTLEIPGDFALRDGLASFRDWNN